jgi:hypothetical protein
MCGTRFSVNGIEERQRVWVHGRQHPCHSRAVTRNGFGTVEPRHSFLPRHFRESGRRWRTDNLLPSLSWWPVTREQPDVGSRTKILLMQRVSKYRAIGSAAVLILVGVMLIGCGHRMVAIDGVFQHGFEKSDFYDRGDCSRKPWWFSRAEADTAFNTTFQKQWELIGRPAAVHIRFVGNISSIGRYGHLGYYRREVVPVRLLELSLSQGCIR